MKDPFDFFRQYTQEKQNVKIQDSRGNEKSRIYYPFITFVPFVIGILNALLLLYIWLGNYLWRYEGIFSFGKSLEGYTGIALYVNAFGLVCGIAAVVLSNRKKYPLIGSILCFVVTIPLLGIYLHFITPFLHR